MAKVVDVSWRVGIRDLAAPVGRERRPGPPQDRRDRARPVHRRRRAAQRRVEQAADAGVINGLRGSVGDPPRRSETGVRVARRGGVSPRRNRAHARRSAGYIEIAAASCANGAAEAFGSMNDKWTNRLSEYVDGELDSAETAALEAHLETCGRCYATVGELRLVVARAKSLADTAPAKDLWAGIRAGMTPAVTAHRPIGPSARRFSFS